MTTPDPYVELKVALEPLRVAHPGHCPCCGRTDPLGAFGVCAGCAAADGLDPACVACLARQAGKPVDGLVHVATCSGNRLHRELIDPSRYNRQP